MKYKIGFVALSLAATTLSACSNDDGTIEKPITEEQVADFFTKSIQVNSGGLMTNSQNAVEKVLKISNKNDFDCDNDYSDNSNFDWNGPLITSNYNSDYAINFDCNGTDIPNFASVSVDTDYNYTSQTLDASSEGVFEASVSGIHTEHENVLLNGSYTHSGDSEFLYFDKSAYTNSTKLSLNNLKLDKGVPILGIKPKVQSGEATVEYNFTSSNGHTYDFVGAIKFTSSRAGEITINDQTFPFGF